MLNVSNFASFSTISFYCRVKRFNRALLISVPVWCATVAGAAAACSSNAPTTGQSVDCTGTNNPAVIAPAGATSTNVTIESGASITGEATAPLGVASAVSVNDTSAIVNNGTILPKLTTPGVTHQGVNLNGNNASLVNNGTILLNNSGSNGPIVNNTLYGVVSSAPNGGTIDYDNISVVNHGTISIQQGAANSTAATVYTGEKIDSFTLDNSGTISLIRTGGTISGTRVGAVGSDDDTDTYTIVNRQGATISATGNNVYGILGRAGETDITNAGTITATGGTLGARGAIVIYGGDDDGPATANIVNKSTGVINGNVIITDGSPFAAASTTPGTNVGAAVGTSVSPATNTRDSTFANQGAVNGGFTYGAGTHVLQNSGTISGPIFVLQAVQAGAPGGAPVGDGGASFTLTNSGQLGGDITIRDRSDSVNNITLDGTGFAGNIVAVNGTGSNTLVLEGVTNLASVRSFSGLNLTRSNVTVANGVTLVDDATIRTTIYGRGRTDLGSIQGTLTLQGDTRIVPRFAATVNNSNIYQLASQVASAGTITVKRTALVSFTPDTSSGALNLRANVKSAASVAPGITTPGAQTIDGLTSYTGSNRQVQALGAEIESLRSGADIAAAGKALSPTVNGADVQTPINSAMLFHQQVDARLDTFLYGQIPASGRSADLGVARPVPVYGVVPPNGAWIEGVGGGVHQSTVAGVNGYNADLTGVIGGYDRLIAPAFRVGAAFGYIDGRVNNNVNQTGTREDIQTYQGLVYAAYEGPRTYLRGSFGYGGVDFATQRNVSFGTFTDAAFGKHDGNILTARGEGGVPVEVHDNLLVPYAAFTYSHLSQDAYQEQSASGAGFGYGNASNDSERSEVGGKAIVPIGILPAFTRFFPSGSVAAIEARAAYVHEFGNVAQQVSASFTGGNSFLVTGPTPNRDMVDYSVGLRVASGRVQIDASYNGLARSSYLEQIGLLRARVLF